MRSHTAPLALLMFFAFALMPFAPCQQMQITVPQAMSAVRPGSDATAANLSTRLTGNGVIAVPEDFSKLRISPGFLLSVDVYDAPDLSGELRVDNAGNAAMLLLGPLHLGGLTLAEARGLIETRLLSDEIMKHPQVTVNIEQYAPFIVAVMGEVQNPGRVQLLAPHSLLDVISQVGGETPMAGNEIEVRHIVEGKEQIDHYPYARGSNGSSIASVLVHDGDTVIVPQAGIVYILGAVNRPGGYLMQEEGHLDVAQALSLAMGTSLQAKVGSIRVLRHAPDGATVEYKIDYKAISEGREKPLRLEPRDIVYVPISKAKAIFTSGSSIVSEATYATVYAAK